MKNQPELRAYIGTYTKNIDVAEAFDSVTPEQLKEKYPIADYEFVGLSDHITIEGVEMTKGKPFYCFRKRQPKKVVENDVPRRARVDLLNIAEQDLRRAVHSIEALGSHTELTDIQTGINYLRDKLADYLEANDLV